MVVIKEFVPNPAGKDADGEYVVLLNSGGQAVSLTGWRLKDASGKSFNLSGMLAPHAERVIPYRESRIVLNNDGEALFLYDAAGILIHESRYAGRAEEGVAYGAPAGEALMRVLDSDLMALAPLPDRPLTSVVSYQEPIAALIVASVLLASLSVWCMKKISIDV